MTVPSLAYAGWSSPIALKLLPTADANSFRDMPPGWTGLPLQPHPGASARVRTHHVHEGVDLYCAEGTQVVAVEPGRVAAVLRFTGAHASPPSPWWQDTWAVAVAGRSGTVLYGEITPEVDMVDGALLERGQPVGSVCRVLSKDKGRPMSMLHLELYEPGSVPGVEWRPGDPCPAGLRDPTPMLMDAALRGWQPPEAPAFLKAGTVLVPISAVEAVDLSGIDRAEVLIRHSGGLISVATGFDAIEAIMLTRASALEGRRLRWRKGAWALHNLLAHPAMQLLAWAGKGRLGVRLHDATTPVPRG